MASGVGKKDAARCVRSLTPPEVSESCCWPCSVFWSCPIMQLGLGYPMLLLAWLAACAAEQLSVHISPSTTSAGSVQPICSGGSDCRQALTATFSLAMIALGEDFGAGALPAALVPFQLDPPIPGKLRWVTTTIARFDPDDDFPPSLNFALRLSGMASRSGATLPADARTEWHFSTPALRMSVARVHSPLALALTGGSWVSSVLSFTARTLTPTATQPRARPRSRSRARPCPQLKPGPNPTPTPIPNPGPQPGAAARGQRARGAARRSDRATLLLGGALVRVGVRGGGAG